jgi:hypothetical protein
MPNPQYDIRSIPIAGLGSAQVVYEFQPDEILVTVEEVVLTGIDIFPFGAQGGAGLALRAQGPVVFPGLQNPQSVRFQNLDAVPHSLRVVAQRGLSPTQIVTPTTLTNPYAGVGMIDTTGWTEDLLGWTWVSTAPDRFSIPGDVTLIYRKGTKVRYKQGGPYKYGYVIASSFAAGFTTVTITGGIDYILVNALISNGAYSHIESPQEFPHWFNYTSLWTASVVNPVLGNGTLTARFCLKGITLQADIILAAGGTTTFGNGIYSLTLPFGAKTIQGVGVAWLNDNAPDLMYIGTPYCVGGVALNVRMHGAAQWRHNSPVAVPAVGDGMILTFIDEML